MLTRLLSISASFHLGSADSKLQRLRVSSQRGPEYHTVLDTKVWAKLARFDYLEGRKESFNTVDYVAVIDPIRKIVSDSDYTPAEVGYALFAYGDVHREGRLH